MGARYGMQVTNVFGVTIVTDKLTPEGIVIMSPETYKGFEKAVKSVLAENYALRHPPLGLEFEESYPASEMTFKPGIPVKPLTPKVMDEIFERAFKDA